MSSHDRPVNTAPGTLIVVEGIDGSGSTTQADLLVQAMQASGIPATFTREPSKGPIGGPLRLHQSKRLELGGAHAEALAFAADRMDHIHAEITPMLAAGVSVVADRFYLSSLAYQAARCDFDWLWQLNRYALRPDVTVFLDVDVDTAIKRIGYRYVAADRFEEDRELLERVAGLYRKAIARLRRDGERIEILDARHPLDEVHARLQDLVWEVVRGRTSPGTDPSSMPSRGAVVARPSAENH